MRFNLLGLDYGEISNKRGIFRCGAYKREVLSLICGSIEWGFFEFQHLLEEIRCSEKACFISLETSSGADVPSNIYKSAFSEKKEETNVFDITSMIVLISFSSFAVGAVVIFAHHSINF